MASIITSKAIGLLHSNGVREDTYARVFRVRGSGAVTHTVVLGGDRPACTCEAGRRGVRCAHLAAAQLQAVAGRR